MFGVVGIVALSACSVSTTGNSITFKTQKEFVDSSQPAKTSTAAWNGESITITNDGVNPPTGDGGIVVNVDPAATQITAQAVFSARADDDAHKEEANSSIRDAIGTFTITEGGEFKIECHHGQAHGTSGVATSGCKLLTVSIPAGTTAKPMKLTVGNGNGDIKFQGSVVASSVKVDNNGTGDVSVNVTPTAGATITVTGENAVAVAVPSTFSATQVILNVNEDDAKKAAARIITTDFPGMESGKSYPVAGATAGAAAELNVQSKGLLDDYTVTVQAQ